MTEIRFFEEGTVPEWTTPEWYASRDNAPHLEQPGHRERLLRTAELINVLEPVSVVDLGAGDGGLLSQLNIEAKWGYDLQQSNVEVAHEVRGVEVSLLDVVRSPERVSWASLAVATEMLEHLIDPHGFVKWVYSHAAVFVASSPWNEVSGNHYEFHTWAWDMEGFRSMFESAGWVVATHIIEHEAQIIVGMH